MASSYLKFESDLREQQEIVAWKQVCKQLQRRRTRNKSIHVDASIVKVSCMVLLMGSIVLAFLGRGTLGLIHGVLGIIYAIEGFYSAVEYSKPTIRDFILWLCASTAACIGLGVYSFETAAEYCQNETKQSKEKRECRAQVQLWTYLYLIMGCVVNLWLFVVFVRFYYKIAHAPHISTRERSENLLD